MFLPSKSLVAGAAMLTLSLAFGFLPSAFAADVATKLPGVVEDCAVAGSGQLLVVKMKGKKELLIYDTEAKKVVKTLEMASADFAFGAGGDALVVSVKDSNEIQSWNLKTFTQVKSKEFADPVNILRIAMGHARGDLAFIRMNRGENQFNQQTMNHFLDVKTLTLIRPKGQQQQQGHGVHHMFGNTFPHYRANADLSRISIWVAGQSPNGMSLILRMDDGFQHHYNHNSYGYITMGDDGNVYTGAGQIFNLTTERKQPFHEPLSVVSQIGGGQSLIPGLGAAFFLGVTGDGKLSLYQAKETSPVCPLDSVPEWPQPKQFGGPQKFPGGPKGFAPGALNQNEQSLMTLDKRIVFAPSAGYILFIPESNDKIIQRSFDLREALNKSGKDYLMVLSNPPVRAKAGGDWAYQINSLAKHGPV